MNQYTCGFYYGLLNLQTYTIPEEGKSNDVWIFCDKEFIHLPLNTYDIYGHYLDAKKVYFNDQWGVSIQLKNYKDLFDRLSEIYRFNRDQAYLYRYDMFSSSILDTYPLEESENEFNIKIRIKTIDRINISIAMHSYRIRITNGVTNHPC